MIAKRPNMTNYALIAVLSIFRAGVFAAVCSLSNEQASKAVFEFGAAPVTDDDLATIRNLTNA